MTDKELIRRALMGDSELQKLCTEKGIVLPCPCCGGRAKKALLLGRFGIACTECPVCIILSPYGDSYKENLKYWNTRPAPPVGRCGDCAFSRELTKDDQKDYRDVIIEYKDVCMCAFLELPELRWEDDFCSYFKRKED